MCSGCFFLLCRGCFGVAGGLRDNGSINLPSDRPRFPKLIRCRPVQRSVLEPAVSITIRIGNSRYSLVLNNLKCSLSSNMFLMSYKIVFRKIYRNLPIKTYIVGQKKFVVSFNKENVIFYFDK